MVLLIVGLGAPVIVCKAALFPLAPASTKTYARQIVKPTHQKTH